MDTGVASFGPLALAIAATALILSLLAILGKSLSLPTTAKNADHMREHSLRVGNYVFIARAVDKDPAAERLAKNLSAMLKSRNIPVYSEKAPEGGDRVEHYERGARTSKVFVPIFTTQFLMRPFPMHELDLALAAKVSSQGRTMLVPIEREPGTLRRDALDKSPLLVQEWRRRAKADSWGPMRKADTDRWLHNLEKVNKIARVVGEEGESEEAFLDRCADIIARAMAQDPFEREYDVFIAHAGDEKDFAVQLRGALEQLGLGIHAFVDKFDLPPGFGDADTRMGEALRGAHVGVAILSNAFFKKKAPMRELEVIVEEDNLLPVLWDITYEDMVKKCQGSQMLQQEGFKRKVFRTTAILAVEEQDFRYVLCQKVAFAVVRRMASKCQLETVNSQAAYTYFERLQRVLRKVVDEDNCMPDILKRNLVEAVSMLQRVEEILEALGDAYFRR